MTEKKLPTDKKVLKTLNRDNTSLLRFLARTMSRYTGGYGTYYFTKPGQVGLFLKGEAKRLLNDFPTDWELITDQNEIKKFWDELIESGQGYPDFDPTPESQPELEKKNISRTVKDDLSLIHRDFENIQQGRLIDSINRLSRVIESPDQSNKQKSEPIPNAKPEAENPTTAITKNTVKRKSLPKLLDSLKNDPNKELTPEDTERLINDRKSKAQISKWLKGNYNTKLSMAFDRMTNENKTDKQSYSTAINTVFKKINPILFEIIDKSLKRKLSRSGYSVGKDLYVQKIKSK